MGYSLTQSAYLCYDTKTGRMYTSRHVKFDEAEFPYSAASRATEIHNSEMDVNPSHVPLHTILPSQLIPQLPRALRLRHHRLLRQHRQPRQHLCHCHSPNNQNLKISLPQLQLLPLRQHTDPTPAPTETSPHSSPQNTSQPNDPIPVQPTEAQYIHLVKTRAKNKIQKPNTKLNLMAQTTHQPIKIPTSVAEALKDPNWRQAMIDEIHAQLKHHTWDLVPPNGAQNLVTCK